MNALSTALKNKIGKVADKLTGTTRVDNMKNPLSAAFRVSASVGKRNPNDPSNPANQFKFATKQKTYGVPGAD